MNTVLIACKTLQKEFELCFKNVSHQINQVIWIESGLHNVSTKLQRGIQEELDRIEKADRVILGFCFCGNAIVGLKTHDFELVFPKTDDCISLMLGSYKKKKDICKQGETYFLTRGWLQSETNIYNEYLFSVEKYGKEMADTLYEDILGAYEYLGIIDTGAYDFNMFLKETEKIAKALKLTQKPLKGTLDYVEDLLCGNYNSEKFILVPKYTEITMDMLSINTDK